jgi:hypothetical protein
MCVKVLVKSESVPINIRAERIVSLKRSKLVLRHDYLRLDSTIDVISGLLLSNFYHSVLEVLHAAESRLHLLVELQLDFLRKLHGKIAQQVLSLCHDLLDNFVEALVGLVEIALSLLEFSLISRQLLLIFLGIEIGPTLDLLLYTEVFDFSPIVIKVHPHLFSDLG